MPIPFPFLGQLLPIAKKAGEAILSVRSSGTLCVQSKADNSPVTAADCAAHQVLVGALPAILPDCPVVSEETPDHADDRCTAERFWLIDPLDGTREFLAGNGEFTVNIALIEHGISVWGMIYAPVCDRLYWGGATWGAFRAHSTGDPEPLWDRGVAVEPECVRVVVSRSHLNAATQAFIQAFHAASVDVLRLGSSLKFCKLAEAEADVYPRFGPTSEWDTAAGQAIVEGAGGSVCDLAGKPLRYGKLAVTNPDFIACRRAGDQASCRLNSAGSQGAVLPRDKARS